jgi:hypothetical protein
VIVNEFAESSRFRFDIEKLFVPFVELQGTKLVYSDKGFYAESRKDLLLVFIGLAEAQPEQILRFASNWGPLGLCRHKLPATHSMVEGVNKRIQKTPCGFKRRESVEQWIVWARKFRAGLKLASSLHNGHHGEHADWALVFSDTGWAKQHYYFGKRYMGYWNSDDLVVEKMWLEDLANYYLEISDVRLRFKWIGNKYEEISPRVFLRSRSANQLFGILAIQFMFMVSNTSALALCTACGQPYFPDRAPRSDESHYCFSCGRKAAVRDASRRFRQKNPNYHRKYSRSRKR